MDPDVALAEIRRIVAGVDSEGFDGERLAELVGGLDEWISAAGYLPSPWGKHWRGVRS